MAALSGSGGEDMTSGQDAQSALLELDKGLRASKVGEQCEAIVKFPALFERFPFPILINSAFLKLSDVFRVGNNFQRLCVLKVTQQSEKHLDKILSTDEFLRRIFSVIHSNDPVARAITLRVLGSIALLISERKNVHHSIRMGLDSHDDVEIDAAIYATSQFCAKSQTFSVSVCDKLIEVIEGLATSMEMKLKLVPIFQYMYHDTQSATKAWKLCTSLLKIYSSKTFVVSILHSLSSLAAASLFNIPAQIELLLSYLVDDPRQSVKRQALLDANILARKSPHVWESKHVKILCEFLSSTPYGGLQVGVLFVLVTLSHSVAVEMLDNEQVLEAIGNQTCSDSVMICALGNEITVNIALTRLKKDVGNKELCEQASRNLETTIIECCLIEQREALEKSLLCVNRLVSQDAIWALNFSETFVGLLTSSSSGICLQIAKGLVSIATQSPLCLDKVRSELYKHFVFICELEVSERSPKAQEFQSLLVAIATLVFQAHQQSIESPVNQQEMKQMILQNLSKLQASSRYWTMYRVAKQAARQGFHAVSQSIFSSLTSMVASVHLHCWIKSLSDFSQAENLLGEAKETLSRITEKTSQAICSFQKGLVALKAAVSANHQLDFHHEFIALRMQTLQIHSFLLSICASIRSCPPSAVAKSIVMATKQDTYMHTRQVVQMNECREKFSSLAASYGKLYRKSFDADPVTLQNIEAHQQSCLLFAYAIDLLMNRLDLARLSPSFEEPLNQNTGNRLQRKCAEILEELQRQYSDTQDKPISDDEIQCLCRMSVCILGIPMRLPRYFFDRLQSTKIKLAISPSQPINNEPHSISVESQMALKIEGVICHGKDQAVFRKIKFVTLLVEIIAEERKESMDVKASLNTPPGPLQQTVEPHNDYFSTQFLLAFPLPNLYAVKVTVAVVDDRGHNWETGPESTLNVKALEVPSRTHRRIP
ncbi:integrator complex subunit 7-like [Dendronephthya gigantea]|uniref:integrator complex subunit 7-like n=1 Tax=Dendronephthya gigantea TaxID=151771 RepID=UPI0010698106|nr:integrator complex subunit 7-like [Dendronephthya gigantea]